jgi:hypothetical protein
MAKLSIGWSKLAVAMKPRLSSSNVQNAEGHGESINQGDISDSLLKKTARAVMAETFLQFYDWFEIDVVLLWPV